MAGRDKLQVRNICHLTFLMLIVSVSSRIGCVDAHGSMTMMDLPPIEIQQAPSCEIQVPDDGQYQYAQLHASMFQSQQTTPLPDTTKHWMVVCDAPTTVVLEVHDMQKNSAPANDSTLFGLGTVNNIGKIGHYQITLKNAEVDSQKVNFYETNDTAVVGALSSQYVISPDKAYGWAGNDYKRSNGMVFSADIMVSPVLNSLQSTNGPLVSGAELNGQAEMIFSFGI